MRIDGHAPISSEYALLYFESGSKGYEPDQKYNVLYGKSSLSKYAYLILFAYVSTTNTISYDLKRHLKLTWVII